jgi:cytochrome P450
LLDRIRRNPADANLFVEELARYRGTVQRASRITTEQVDVAGVTIPAGAIIRLLPAAANRDSSKYPDGETFDIDRTTDGHLGFGHGVHSCLGAPLARLETQVTVEILAAKLGSLALSQDKPIEYVRGNNLTNSGPEHLHVELEKFNA